MRTMNFFPSPIFKTPARYAMAAALMAFAFTGCKSKQDTAIDQAKQQAASTGQPQQVISTDKDGNTVTTTVQPPQQGQGLKDEVVTTTVTPKSAAAANPSGPASQPGQPSPSGQATAAAPQQPAPPPPPPPVHVPAGTSLAIRIDQRISAKDSRAGDKFTGELVEPVMQGDKVVIPKKTPVGGIVDVAHKRGHFKGASNLELRLTSLTLNGTEYPLETADMRERKKGKGKRTAAMIGGGAGLGMLIGGVASGGTGLLIGGLAGAGAGTAGAGLTGNRDLVIPAESIIHFKLADDLVLQP
jgi:hypothetical protein